MADKTINESDRPFIVGYGSHGFTMLGMAGSFHGQGMTGSDRRQYDGITRVDPKGIRTLFEFCLSIRPIFELLYGTGHQEVILRFYLQGAAPVIAQADAKTYYFIQFITFVKCRFYKSCSRLRNKSLFKKFFKFIRI